MPAEMEIIWTIHAEERQKEWQKTLGITKEEVEESLKDPGQIVQGDMEIKVAQSKTRSGLLRVPFKEVENDRKVLTVYWTSKVKKYWE